MKTLNAIKKLEKAGYKVSTNENLVEAYLGEYRVAFYCQGEKVSVLWTDCQRARETRDSMTDYFPETFHKNIKQAIEFNQSIMERKSA